MSTNSVPAKTLPPTAPPHSEANGKSPTLAEAAAVLLPGLWQATSLLHVATRVLQELSGHPLPRAGDAAAEAEKARRLLAAFGHVPKRS